MNYNKEKKYFGALTEDYISPFDTGELKIVDGFYVKYVKRALDIFLALPAVVLTLPINIAIGFITYFKLGRPLFFSHERPGLGERPFTVVKFRNMTNETDENGLLLPPAERVTEFGKFIRKTSLDELLQFWLILKGDMSFIGPRPLLMKYLPRYNLRQHMRHAVKPGLECPMRSYSKGSPTWQERFDNDIWYVEHISFKTDILMIIRLVKLVFNSKRSQVRGEKIDREFKGNDDSQELK